MLQSIHQVNMLPGLFEKRMALNRDYLLELDPGCLLQNFYLEAGIIPEGCQVIPDPSSAKMHWGWEAPSCQLRGHFLGHWLSAAAILAEEGNQPVLEARIDHIVSELARCQELNGGQWVGSIPEKYFDRLIAGTYIWSPQYTMHKTIMGLLDVYERLHSPKALVILDKLADWYLDWVEKANAANPYAVYSGEQAGMLEMWARLYALTGKEKYQTLIHAYEDNALFERLDSGTDALSDDHANASIPLAHGIAAMYELTGDEKWLRRMNAFWKTAVDERGMYATTGSNAGEFWIPPHQHGKYLGQRDQEFCTVYNMVRTAEILFRWTEEPRYADYIERALYNGFLAQQNRETGMPTYFLPLAAGSRKKWGSRTRDFWCCFGTMVQAQALYPELIWYQSAEGITVSQYIPSETCVKRNGEAIRLRQEINMKNYNNQVMFDEHSGGRISRWSLKLTVESACQEPWTLKLRIPSWCEGLPALTLNGRELGPEVMRDGMIRLNRTWGEKDELDLFFPVSVHFEPLEGAEEIACAVEGPIVLAGLTTKDSGLRGDLSQPEELLLPALEHTYETFVWNQSEYSTRRQRENFRLIPLYDVTDEPYTVYFTTDRA